MFSPCVVVLSAHSRKVCYACCWGLRFCRYDIFIESAKKCITYSERIEDKGSHNVFSCYESCTQLLSLPFSLMQTSTINTLLEKLPEFMLDGSVFEMSSFNSICTSLTHFFSNVLFLQMSSCSVPRSAGDAGISIPRIIINQLKWLDRVVDSKVVLTVMTGYIVCSVVTTIEVLKVFVFLLICSFLSVLIYFFFIAVLINVQEVRCLFTSALFMFCPCILQELAAKLMELVSVAPVDVQRDIITSLPEILEDSQHNDIARELKYVQWSSTTDLWPCSDLILRSITSGPITQLNASWDVITKK